MSCLQISGKWPRLARTGCLCTQKWHLGGCSELFTKRAGSGRKLALGWQTRLGMCSPDAQDSKKCWVGYPGVTLWWSAGPKSKISKPTWSTKNFEIRKCFENISKIDFFEKVKNGFCGSQTTPRVVLDTLWDLQKPSSTIFSKIVGKFFSPKFEFFPPKFLNFSTKWSFLLTRSFHFYLFLVYIGSGFTATREIWMFCTIFCAWVSLFGILFTLLWCFINSWFMRSVPLSEAFKSPNVSKSSAIMCVLACSERSVTCEGKRTWFSRNLTFCSAGTRPANESLGGRLSGHMCDTRSLSWAGAFGTQLF